MLTFEILQLECMMMDLAEKKLDLFRRIDKLDFEELSQIYGKIIQVLNDTKHYPLSEKEKRAIDEDILDITNGDLYTTDQIVAEAKQKYSNRDNAKI